MNEAHAYLAEILAFEKADQVERPPTGAVLFVGSSTIRLWETLKEDFAPVPVINRGFGGSEVTDLIGYLGRVILPYRPRLMVVYSGDNDLTRGKSPETVFADYQQFIALVQQHLPQTRIILVSTKPSPARAELIPDVQKLNAFLQEFVLSDDRLAYVDIYSAMIDDAGSPRAELFTDDGLHMNSAGYQLWKERIQPFLQ